MSTERDKRKARLRRLFGLRAAGVVDPKGIREMHKRARRLLLGERVR
jgi:hypothetical protein